ncbi:MAG: hypothetical protein ABSD72_04245 [Terracidiphilus sp.]|jgi:hypothetical protein
MSENDSQRKTSAYTFQGTSPADQFLEIARIHHLEAKQLFENAEKARLADREQEYKLLLDVATSREERAMEFERAAKGECDDPIVSEIVDGLDETRVKFTPYAPTLMTEEDLAYTPVVEKPKHNPIARAVAWVGSWVTK